MSLDPLFAVHPRIQVLVRTALSIPPQAPPRMHAPRDGANLPAQVFGYEIIELGPGPVCALLGAGLLPECQGEPSVPRCVNGGPGLGGTYALQDAANALQRAYPENIIALDVRGSIWPLLPTLASARTTLSIRSGALSFGKRKGVSRMTCWAKRSMQAASGTIDPPFPNLDFYTPTACAPPPPNSRAARESPNLTQSHISPSPCPTLSVSPCFCLACLPSAPTPPCAISTLSLLPALPATPL